jgi:single-stranded DNA-binding protein
MVLHHIQASIDLVGVKGRLQTRSYEVDKETKYVTEVIVDKVSFLASKRDEVKEEDKNM